MHVTMGCTRKSSPNQAMALGCQADLGAPVARRPRIAAGFLRDDIRARRNVDMLM